MIKQHFSTFFKLFVIIIFFSGPRCQMEGLGQIINCPVCLEPLNQKLLSHHLWAGHKEYAITSGFPDPLGDSHKTRCPMCRYTCKFTLFRKHLGLKHGVEVSKNVKLVVGKESPEPKEKRLNLRQKFFPHLKGNDSVLVKCPFCDETLPVGALGRHQYGKHRSYYECRLCPETFSSENIKRAHMVSVHGWKRSYKKHPCNLCGKMFDFPTQVKQHVKIEHEKQRNFLCDFCGESFRRKQILNKHRNAIHLNLKSFQCKICNKLYKDSSSCKNHIKKVHKVEVKGRLNNPVTGPSIPMVKIDPSSKSNPEKVYEMTMEKVQFDQVEEEQI